MFVISGGSTCLNDAADRYARNMTSFGVPDATITSAVSKCDVSLRDDRVFAGQYRYSPASTQVRRHGVFSVISRCKNIRHWNFYLRRIVATGTPVV